MSAGSPLLGLALLLLATSASAASVYRWVDRNGVVHYDDTNSTGTRMTREYLAGRDIPEEPEWSGTIPGDIVAEVRQRCSNARARLQEYRSAPQIYGRDPSGNVYALSPAQSRLMMAEIQAEADRYCAPGATRQAYADRIAAVKAERARAAEAATRRKKTITVIR